MKTKIITLVAFSLLLSACNRTPQIKKVVFTSIQDAINQKITIKCQYISQNQSTTTYIKGQTVRLIGNDQSTGIEGLIKDDKFYLWNSQDKKGMIIDISKTPGAKMGNKPINSIDDIVNVLEEEKDKCVISSESDSIFDLPTDINFTSAPDLFGNQK